VPVGWRLHALAIPSEWQTLQHSGKMCEFMHGCTKTVTQKRPNYFCTEHKAGPRKLETHPAAAPAAAPYSTRQAGAKAERQSEMSMYFGYSKATAGAAVWACSNCTFDNLPLFLCCDMCLTPRCPESPLKKCG
jgi:hypothetical protein